MLLLAATLSLPAHATTQRAFVATTGNDANAGVNCSRVSPCRSFAVAIGVTDPGGSVVVLDSGGYGAVTITQAVAIISPPGVHAAITAASGQPGIVVNAPSLAVTLRGLYLEGKGVGTNGIEYHVRDDSTLFVENVVVDGFAGNGIAMVRESALEHATLIVQDCVVRDNGQSGIYLTNGNPADPGPQGSIIVENSRVTHNGFGIVSDGGLAQIRNSIIADGTAGFSSGVWARGNDAATRLLVTGSLVHRWYAGLRSSNSSTIEVGASAVNYNAIGRGKETGGLLVSRTGNVFSADLGEASFDSTLATE
jgi:hypothetical protein